MTTLLDDGLNLKILENICSGQGVEINVSLMADMFKKHRNTVKSKANGLVESGVIAPPSYPFMSLYSEYPLLVVATADLPRTEKIEDFLKHDEHIFAAFYVREEEYNTLLIEYHKDIYEYGEWRKRLVEEEIIPPRRDRYPAQSLFFSNRHIFKYAPHYALYKIEDRVKQGERVAINGHELDGMSFQILKKLMLGDGIRTNENYLSQKLKTHRKTIERRIEAMVSAGVISRPVCRFPKFFGPSNQILTLTLMEATCNARDKIMKALKTDPAIPVAMEANVGRYSFLLFGSFSDLDEHLEWEERYNKRFPNCLGAMRTTYLSPVKTASIDQQKVSLGIIRGRLRAIEQGNA